MAEEEKKQYDDEINLLDILVILVKHKKLIISTTLAVALITIIISLIMTPIYKAKTEILLPQQPSSISSQLLGQFGGAGGLAGGLAGGALNIKTPEDLYIGLLKSRPVLDYIIDKFNLMKLYKAKNREGARKALLNVLDAEVDQKSGIITITVEDKNPKRAADMANAFVDELRNFTKGLSLTEASQRRLFFEEQLKNTKESLIKAGKSLNKFQEKTGAIDVNEQTKAVIGSIAQLRAQIAAQEVQLKVMGSYTTSQNVDLQRAEERLRGLKMELSKLETKSSDFNLPNPMMPTEKIPGVGTEYIKKLRDFEFYENLYELLLKQYEAAKLDEAKNFVVIQTIEKAIPPEIRAKPKRGLMVVVATIAGFFLSIFAAFLMEYIENVSNDPENKQKLDAIKKYAIIRPKKVRKS